MRKSIVKALDREISEMSGYEREQNKKILKKWDRSIKRGKVVVHEPITS